VRRLNRRFQDSEMVRVTAGDACKVALPEEPFRAFGNIPFHITTALLRRLLDDPGSPLERADLVLPRGVARKRGRARGNLLAVSWAPWWEFRILRGLPGDCFRPAPDVAAAFVAITRRSPPLLGLDHQRGFRTFVSRGFNRANLPVRRSLKGEMPPRRLKQALRAAGAPPHARPTDLGARDWVTIYGFWRAP
jgi:23S rRNA (adenine-N6)-dimethyltransferase